MFGVQSKAQLWEEFKKVKIQKNDRCSEKPEGLENIQKYKTTKYRPGLFNPGPTEFSSNPNPTPLRVLSTRPQLACSGVFVQTLHDRGLPEPDLSHPDVDRLWDVLFIFLQDGGKVLEEGMSHNSSLVECDIRLTDVDQESEFCITQALRANQNHKHHHSPTATQHPSAH